MPLDDRRGFLRWLALLPGGSLFAALPTPSRVKPGLPRRLAVPEVPVPAGARRLGSSRFRMPGFISALQFSPDGKTLVAGGGDEIRGWDVATGKLRFSYGYPAGDRVDSGRLTSRDGLVLLIPDPDRAKTRIHHYHCTHGGEAHPRTTLKSSGSNAAFSLDGTRMILNDQDHLMLFDTLTAAEVWRVEVVKDTVMACRFFDDGSTIAVGLRDEIHLLAIADGKLLRKLVAERPKPKEGENDIECTVQHLEVSSNGNWLAAAIGENGQEDNRVVDVHLWDTATGKHRLKCARQTKVVGFTASELVTFRKGVATFWKLDAGTSRSVVVPDDEDLTISPDGRLLACPGSDAVLLFDVATLKDHPLTSDPPGQVWDLQFLDRNRLRGTVSFWGGWVEWDLAHGTSRLFRGTELAALTPISASRDGKRMLYQSAEKFLLRQADEAKAVVEVPRPVANTAAAHVLLTPDGRTLVSWSQGTLTLIGDAGNASRTIEGGNPGAAIALALSTDRSTVVVASSVSENVSALDVFDLATGRHRRRIGLEGEAVSLRLSRDGSSLLVTLNAAREEVRFGEQTLGKLFDTATGKAVWTSGADTVRATPIALSPSGRIAAVVRKNKEVELWESMANGVRRRLAANGDVGSIAFSPDGRRLAVSVDGAPVFHWDLFASDGVVPPDANALDRAWVRLRESSIVANAGITTFVVGSTASVAFLRSKLPPAVSPDGKRIERLIADLDGSFRRREQAMKDLAALGEAARGPLKQALAGSLSPEARERVEKLLSVERKLDADSLRMLRAVEVAELIGTPEALSLLKHWADGAAGMVLTEEAAAAHRRITSSD